MSVLISESHVCHISPPLLRLHLSSQSIRRKGVAVVVAGGSEGGRVFIIDVANNLCCVILLKTTHAAVPELMMRV